MAEEIKKRCVLCVESDSEGQGKLCFPKNAASWFKLKEVSEARGDGLNIGDAFQPDTPILYHERCREKYANKKNIQKYLKEKSDTVNTQTCSEKITRKRNSWAQSSTLPKQCIYCNTTKYMKSSKTRESLHNVSTLDIDSTVKKAADEHIKQSTNKNNVASILLGILHKDLVSSEAVYHKSCHVDFCRILYPRQEREKETRSCEYEAVEDAAFRTVINLCQNVLDEPRIIHFTELRSVMEDEFSANGVEWLDVDKNNFARKLRHQIGDSFTFVHARHKTVLIVPSSLKVETLVVENYSLQQKLKQVLNVESSEDLCRKTGEVLHNKIKEIQAKLPWPPMVEDLRVEKVSQYIPKELMLLMEGLIPQSSVRGKCRQLSLAQDLVYCVAGIRTPKSVLFPAVIKGLTNNTATLRLINKLGHGVSYDVLEELDTLEALRNIDYLVEGEVIIPSSFTPAEEPGSVALMISDNIDNLERTLSGSGTSHRVNSILVTKSPHSSEELITRNTHGVAEEVEPAKKKVKTLANFVKQKDLPYIFPASRKGPGVLDFSADKKSNYDILSRSIKTTNILWALSRHISSRPNMLLPSWTGFNIMINNNAVVVRSKIGYLDTLDHPATDTSTIYTLLKRAVEIRQRLNLSSVVAVFDQAMYAKASQVLWEKKEEFPCVVLMLGTFHLLLAMLAVIGKRFGDAGIKEAATLSGIVAEGSINTVISGKCYSRAVRLYKLLYEALLRMLFEMFISSKTADKEESVKNLQAKIDEFVEDINQESFNDILNSSIFREWVTGFNTFIEECKNENGDLFRFWLSFLDIMDIFLCLISATRTGDWFLYVSTLEETIPWMFAYDRQNYARYLIPHLNDMKRLKENNKDVYEAFCKGEFAVQLSDMHTFSSVEADKAIEMTINKDCKTTGGFIGFSSNFAATQRWVLNNQRRSSYKVLLEEMTVYDTQKSKHPDISESRIDRDEKDVQSIINLLNNSLQNPWNGGELRSISTGLIPTESVKEDLMTAHCKGLNAAKSFVKERLTVESTKQFHDALQKIGLKTFSSLSKKITCSKKKDVAITANASLFARLAIIGQHRKVDLRVVLEYPLGPVPWALSDAMGYPRKTVKSQLWHILEKDVPAETVYPHNAASVFDGLALLRKVKIPNGMTFFAIGETIFDKLLQCPGNRIDVVFDVYKSNSIKDFERGHRQENTLPTLYANIKEGFKVRCWSQFLAASSNKANLIRFLTNLWGTSAFRSKLQSRVMFIAAEDKCWKLTSHEIVEYANLICDHEEADTRLALHAAHVGESNIPAVVVHADDTDVLVILLGFIQDIKCKLYVKIGQQGKTRIVALKNVVSKLRLKLPDGCDIDCFVKALIGFHSFTGCDTISAFYGKGKGTPFKLMSTVAHYVKSFKTLGEEWTVTEPLNASLEQFVCQMYGGKETNDVNKLRYDLYCSKGGSIMPELLPPCRSTLRLHAIRANYQAAIWRRSLIRFQMTPTPYEHGWCNVNGHIDITWLGSLPAPEEVLEMVSCAKCKTCHPESCPCFNVKLPCTDLCRCSCDEQSTATEYEEFLTGDSYYDLDDFSEDECC